MEEELKSSRIQKILAVGIVIFFLICGGSFLISLGGWIEKPSLEEYERLHAAETYDELRIWENKRTSAEKKLNSCEKEYQEKTEKYEFLREEYRISLEEKKVNKPLYNEYTKAKDEYE